MLPVMYGENMFDDFFGDHNPLFGKNGRNLMKTDIRETDDAKSYRLAVERVCKMLYARCASQFVGDFVRMRAS